MNAKEKQIEFIKAYLKPKLKEEGFKTSGQTWWKIIDDFFILINLQNSQWNSKEELSFCFNIGVGLTERMNNPKKKKPTYFDLAVPLREDYYLPEARKNHCYRKEGWLGYILTDKTDYNEFKSELRKDFEQDILPKLNGLKTIDDCLKFYENDEFWNNNLRVLVEQINKTYK